jgi:hypothetical protein
VGQPNRTQLNKEQAEIPIEEERPPSAERTSKGPCSEAPVGATEQNLTDQGTSATPLIGEEHSASCSHTMESLEGLTEKVGTLGLQVRKRNRCGSARKRARKAKSVEAPTGATDGGQPQSAAGGPPLDSQKPGTSGAQRGRGPAASVQKSPSSEGHPRAG